MSFGLRNGAALLAYKLHQSPTDKEWDSSLLCSLCFSSQIDIPFYCYFLCGRFRYAFCATKPVVVAPMRGGVEGAVGTPETVGIVEAPRPAPQHPSCFTFIIPVLAPLPDIA